MGTKYNQLNEIQREELFELLQSGNGKLQIAEKLGCHKSTIYRELGRNKCRVGYLPDRAQKMSNARRTKPLKIERNPDLKNEIVSHLEAGWSPEQIAGRLKEEKGITVISHETIYGYIYSKQGIANQLYVYLKRQRKKRQSKIGRKSKCSPIPNRIPIHDRPQEVERRVRFGDWEGDLMLFSDQPSVPGTVRQNFGKK